MLLAPFVAACAGEAPQRVQLRRVSPASGAGCGAAADARQIVVTALGEFAPSEATARSRSTSLAGPWQITGLPVATRVLAVEVIGAGGALRAVGRTAPFSAEEPGETALVPIFMAPPRGFCRTGALAAARSAPLVAAAGRGVLVAGGTGDDGPVRLVEWYDPETGTFAAVDGQSYGQRAPGLAGASVTALPDGRAVIAGGPETAYQLFVPEALRLEPSRFLPQPRAHHAAAALGDGRVLLAGGCERLDDTGRCTADSLLPGSAVLDVERGTLDAGPALQTARVAGQAVSLADGSVLLVGGLDASGQPLTSAERLDLARGTSEPVDRLGGSAALLASGAVVTGFAPAGTGAAAAAAFLAPGESAGAPLPAASPARAGATLTPLEDGSVLALGGAAGSIAAATYSPLGGRFEPIGAAGEAPQARSAHAALRLADGTVLLLGGRDDAGRALADAWIFRPPLTGPWTGELIVTFAEPGPAAALLPRDPRRGSRVAASAGAPAHYRLVVAAESPQPAAPSLPREWAVVAGPLFARPQLSVRARVDGGGLALLLAFRDASHLHAAVLVPGEPAALWQLEGADVRQLPCARQAVVPPGLWAGTDTHSTELGVRGGRLVVLAGGTELLRCAEPPGLAPGLVGVGVVGDAGTTLRLDSLAASR